MTIEGPRILDKPLPGLTVGINPEAPYYTMVHGPWDVLSDTCFARRDYFDLSGYTLDDLTCFIQGVDIQEGFTAHGNLSYAWVVDLITTEFIDDAAILAMVANFTGDAPGFPESTYDMSQVSYGRCRTFKGQTIASVPIATLYQTGVTNFGTNQGTTGHKLYITRVLAFTGLPTEFISIPPSNFVVAAIVAKEKELPYLMRMKRSYEIATGP